MERNEKQFMSIRSDTNANASAKEKTRTKEKRNTKHMDGCPHKSRHFLFASFAHEDEIPDERCFD